MSTLLQKAKYSPDPTQLFIEPTSETVIEWINYLGSSNLPVSIDIETTGLDPRTDTIVCIGIKSSVSSICIDTRDEKVLRSALLTLNKYQWYAFNTTFDGMFIELKLREYLGTPNGTHINIVGDSYVLWKMLSNEGYFLQNWRLETAITNVLGWPINTKETTGDLLKKRGLSKGNMSKLMDTDIEVFMDYCQQDAVASYQLLEHCTATCIASEFQMTLDTHAVLFTTLIKCTIEQKLSGVDVLLDDAIEYADELESKLAKMDAQFLNLPNIKPIIDSYNAPILEAYTKPTSTTKTIWAKKADKPWESDEWTKGERKNTAKWEVEFGSWYKTITSVRFPKRSKPVKTFNVDSTKQLKWLLYEHNLVDFAITKEPDPTNPNKYKRKGEVTYYIKDKDGNNQEAPLFTTDAGALPVDKKALTFFGEAGKLLKDRNEVNTLLQYVNSLISVTDVDTKKWYPDLKIHGTVTGRSSGGMKEGSIPKKGKLSPQILPKDKRFLSLLTGGATPLYHLDFSSVEPTVLAETTKDPVLLDIYAGEYPHDLYLYFAIKNSANGAAINKIYNIDSPTQESIDAAKKAFPIDRTISKVGFLSDSYGAGPESKRRGLMQEGIFLSFEQAKKDHDALQNTLKVSKEYQTTLESEWEDRGGYIVSPVNLPMCVADDKLKDCTSRNIQGSAHLILMVFIHNIHKLRAERNIIATPWDVDLHDATIWKSNDPRFEQVMSDALVNTNEWLQGELPIKGEVDKGNSFYDFK